MTDFRLEKDMTPIVEQWMLDQGLHVKREFSAPWAIVDLVGCEFDRENAERRLAHGPRKPIGPQFRVALLLAMTGEPRGWTRAELMAKLNRCKQAPLGRDLATLGRDGFARKDADGTYHRCVDWLPISHRIVAVELKLRRASEVVRQAAAHHGFAHCSWIAMPIREARRLAEAPLARRPAQWRPGLGILGVRHNSVVVLEIARYEVPVCPATSAHTAERFWRTHRPKGRAS